MGRPLTGEELEELEAEGRAVSVWALDEADVRMLQLRRRAFAELRELRERVEGAESELAEIKGLRSAS